jgi:hypothetical protein
MRLALLVVVVGLAGCLQQTFSDPPPSGSGGWGTGPGGTGGDTSYGCHKDADCGTDVCARNGSCLPASSVVTVHVTWTVNDQPAGAQTCQVAPDLDLSFFASSGDEFGFAPVPCAEGKFTVDKLPSWYESVQLSRSGDYGTGGGSAAFTDGTASINLVY